MKSSIFVLSTLIVLVNLLLSKNDNSIIVTKTTDVPARSIFENEIMKPIYDSDILVHAIEKKLMN
ncbi:hypothetical protein CL614_07940 [archaeon]|nr:hypothetical protein [archaeon]